MIGSVRFSPPLNVEGQYARSGRKDSSQSRSRRGSAGVVVRLGPTRWRRSSLAQAGELRRAIESPQASEATIAAALGEFLARDDGRRSTPQEVAVYKSVGVAAQDLVLAIYALHVGDAQRRGELVEI